MTIYVRKEIEKAFRKYINTDMSDKFDTINIEDFDERAKAVDKSCVDTFFEILESTEKKSSGPYYNWKCNCGEICFTEYCVCGENWRDGDVWLG